MNNNNAVIGMEASLLMPRIKGWFISNVGTDIKLFRDQTALPTRQEEIIQTTLRFTNSLLVSLDIIGELVYSTSTIKFLLANTLRMIEVKSKSER